MWTYVCNTRFPPSPPPPTYFSHTGTEYISTVVPLLKATLTRGHPSYEARIFCPHYYKVNRFLPLAKGHLSYVATICSQIGWPYKRGTTVF